jgi:molybdopterin synthase catalytic subunit
VAQLRAGNAKVGGIVTFVGTVRDLNDGADVAEMELEHYPGMTEQSIEAIVAQAKARWPIYGALVIHRIGPLKPTEQIVLVAVTSAHRGEAFAACEFIIDYLKTEAPFWKKEVTPDGARWVDARVSDDAALQKWRG